MISDTQRWYDETEKAVEALNARDDIDFVLHGGDLSDFGLKKEFMWQRDILNRLRVPYVCLLGNHDCQGTGEAVFEKIFGPSDFAFTAADVRFVCLNTNAMEYDYSHPVPDFDFLEHEYGSFAPPARRTIFAMHVRPYDFQFNNNVAKVFEHYVMRFPQPLCCIFGHEHRWIEEDIFGDGMMYYGCPNIEKRTYILYTLTPDGYSYEKVDFLVCCSCFRSAGWDTPSPPPTLCRCIRPHPPSPPQRSHSLRPAVRKNCRSSPATPCPPCGRTGSSGCRSTGAAIPAATDGGA